MRKIIKKIPFIGFIIVKIYRKFKPGPKFISSNNYWEKRYKNGGNSGSGSYGKLAEFKTNFINSFLAEYKIKNAVEFGCGDGNQLKDLNYKKYLGLDVSLCAIQICKEIYKQDKSKSFDLIQNIQNIQDLKFELVLSLDVIYHLVENNVYETYMKSLFDTSKKYVIIYSSNVENNLSHGMVEHVWHRKFTNWIEKNISDFKLIEKHSNKYPYDGDGTNTSHADFYVYEKD